MLFRKMLRDMKLNKTQFIAIFLMSFLGVFIYAGVGSEWYGLKTTVNHYYEETNLANVWVYGNGFSAEDVSAVSQVDGVTGVQRRLTLNGIADFENSPTLTLHFVENNKISKCLLVDGEEFSLSKDGIWLDSQFSNAKGIKVGDTISITANNIILVKKVLGTVFNPEYIYSAGNADIVPNHSNYGFGYLPHKAFPDIMPIFYTELLVTTTDTINDASLEEEIDTALGGQYSVYISRKNMKSYAMFDSEINEHKAMGQIFPVAFLIIAMLSILTTMARMVNNQRTQIGTLKAIGFKNRRILFHYISYGLWLSLAGAVTGSIVGPLTIPYLFYGPMQSVFTLPQWRQDVSFSIILMAAASVAGCTITTYFACRSVLKDMPSQTLRPKVPKAIKQGFLERSKLWSKLGFNAQWNLRDVFRSKVRSSMAIVGVLGCTALLVCAFGMQDSMDDIVTWNYHELSTFQTKLALSESVTEDQINSILNQHNGEAMVEGAIELKANGIKKSGELLVTDQVTLIRYEDANRNFIELPEGSISISYKMAEFLNLKVGDKFSWHIYGDEQWVTTKVGAIYRNPISQGITMERSEYEKLGYTFAPTSIITAESINSEINGVAKIWSIEDLTESYKTMTEAMDILVYVLIVAAIVLAVVVLYNLGVLSFTERQRELSTLKVIGFKTKKIRTLLLSQNMWLTALGIILGLPIGRWLIDYILVFMRRSFDIMTIISVSSLLYSIVGTFLLSLLVNRMFSSRVKNIDMVSSLKGVE